MKSVLDVRDLTKSYKAPDGALATIVDVPRFSLAPGQQVAIGGVSGSGKTTFLNLIAGLVHADRGSIRVAGHELAELGQAARDRVRARHVGYVFQTFNLLQGYSALENVLMGMMFGEGVDARLAHALLERVGLKRHMHHRPRELSVGQQQRVAVARALASRPTLVLADEPTGNLDIDRAHDAMLLIRELCQERQTALVVVSHGREVLRQFDDVRNFQDINRAAQKAAA